MTLIDEIKGILGSVSIVDETKIEPKSTLRTDLGIDSFGTMDIVVKIEKKYGVKIIDKQIHRFVTVQDVVSYVQENAALAKE